MRNRAGLSGKPSPVTIPDYRKGGGFAASFQQSATSTSGGNGGNLEITYSAAERQIESACVMLTDLHFGRATADFNVTTCRERIWRAGRKVDRIRELLSGYEFDHLYVYLGGDVIDGEAGAIYPNQATEQDVHSGAKQAEQFSSLMAVWLTERQKVWGNVTAWTIPGNHGKHGMKSASNYTNFDTIAYRRIADLVAVAGIEVILPDDHDVFFRVVTVRDRWKFLLTHGHYLTSLNAAERMINKWQTTDYGPLDAVLCGHRHHSVYHAFNRTTLLQSSSILTGDVHARNRYGAETKPETWMFGISDSRPITFLYPLDLGRD
jgi:predicted phosphodiesterase